MGITNKLCNATPFDVEIPYTAAINIFVPADGQADLSMSQMEDYSPGRPGSAEPRSFIASFGVFLLDTDRSYDSQVYETLQLQIGGLRQKIAEWTNNLRDSRLATGTAIDAETMKEMKRTTGFLKLEEKLVVLQKRAALYAKALESAAVSKPKGSFDPEKTCFSTEPPKQFATKTALAIFLAENPELFQKHKDILATMVGKKAKNESEQHSS